MKNKFLIHSIYGNYALNKTDGNGNSIRYGLRLAIRLGEGEDLNKLETLKFRIENMLQDGWRDLNEQ